MEIKTARSKEKHVYIIFWGEIHKHMTQKPLTTQPPPHTLGVQTYSPREGGWFWGAFQHRPLSTCYVAFVIGISCFISMTKFLRPSPHTPCPPLLSLILWSPRAKSLLPSHHPPSQLVSLQLSIWVAPYDAVVFLPSLRQRITSVITKLNEPGDEIWSLVWELVASPSECFHYHKLK